MTHCMCVYLCGRLYVGVYAHAGMLLCTHTCFKQNLCVDNYAFSYIFSLDNTHFTHPYTHIHHATSHDIPSPAY